MLQSTILREAEEITGGDRNKDYGHPIHDFKRQAALLSTLGFQIKQADGTYRDIEAADIPVMMICVKLSRQSNRKKRDNLVDMAGYIRCWDEVELYESKNPGQQKTTQHDAEKSRKIRAQSRTLIVEAIHLLDLLGGDPTPFENSFRQTGYDTPDNSERDE